MKGAFDGNAARKLENLEDNLFSTETVRKKGEMPRATWANPNNEEKKTLNPFKRWFGKAKKVAKNYTDFGNPIKLWKPLAAGYVAKKLRAIETEPEERGSFFSDLFGSIVTMSANSLERYHHMMPYQISPALRLHLSAAEGASTFEHVYLYDKPGDNKGYVIYLGNETPDNDMLRENIDHVDNKDLSPYEDEELDFRERLQGFFDTQDGPPVMDVATLFDYTQYFSDEPDRIHRWGTKDDSWLANQYGERDTAEESSLPADLAGKVRIYKRPVGENGFFYKLGEVMGDESPRSGRMWLEWAVKKPLIYAFADALLEPLETAMEKILPVEAVRDMVYAKAKGVAASWRGFSNPNDFHLAYD